MASCCGRSCRGRCQPPWQKPSRSQICMPWVTLSSRPSRHPKHQLTDRTTSLAPTSRGRCKIFARRTCQTIVMVQTKLLLLSKTKALFSIQGLMGRSSGRRGTIIRGSNLMARKNGSRERSLLMSKCSTDPAVITRSFWAAVRSQQQAMCLDCPNVER